MKRERRSRLAWLGILWASTPAAALTDSVITGRWKASVGLESRTLPLTLRREGPGDRFEYAPNNAPDLRLGLQYQGYGVSVAYGLGKMKDDVDVRTKYFDLQFRQRASEFGIDVFWQRFEGYYLRPGEGPVRTVLPGMTVSTQVVNVYRKLWGGGDLASIDQPSANAHRFSVVVYGLTGLARRASSSPIPLLPDSSTRRDPETVDLREIDVLAPRLSLGLGLPAHLGGFFVLPSLRMGFGYPIPLSGGIDTDAGSTDLAVRLVVGYQGPIGSVDLTISDDSDAFGMSGLETVQYHSLLLGFTLTTNL